MEAGRMSRTRRRHKRTFISISSVAFMTQLGIEQGIAEEGGREEGVLWHIL